MPSSIPVFGLTFHLYGLILGIATVVAVKIATLSFKENSDKAGVFDRSLVWIVLGMVLGARVWHVITDWSLYVNQPWEVFYVWNGGLSIIGALMGIFLAVLMSAKYSKGTLQFFELSDAIAVGLPFGQAIGRLGNWVNQELYGLPTDLPWKIYIDSQHRLKGYEDAEYFHPLFAYEAILMLGVGMGLWLLTRQNKNFVIGSSLPTFLYLAAYGWIRFWLEFLRIDKAVVGTTGVGINQIIMFTVAVAATVYILKKLYVKK